MEDKEIEAILAHELGHFHHKHTRQRMISSFVFSFVSLAILGYLINQVWFYNGLGISTPSAHTALVLFSFALPWEDIEKRCVEANEQWQHALDAVQNSLALPHSEEVLAAMVNVHIVGGAKDLVQHLDGAKMRPNVVLKLISELRQSGYPGYDASFNAEKQVERRMQDMYSSKYGEEAFVPDKVKEAVEKAHRAKLTGT